MAWGKKRPHFALKGFQPPCHGAFATEHLLKTRLNGGTNVTDFFIIMVCCTDKYFSHINSASISQAHRTIAIAAYHLQINYIRLP